MPKLLKSFYQQPAEIVAPKFLGKYLVFNSPFGKISGRIIDVEAYPAGIDKIAHGNVRSKRTEAMFGGGGFVYIYKIYGIYHQFGIVVNKVGIADALLIRGVEPCEGIEIMKKNFGREVKNILDLTKSPGNLSKSFGFDLKFYGEDLTGDKVYIEDRGEKVGSENIIVSARVGISSKLQGNNLLLRFTLKVN